MNFSTAFSKLINDVHNRHVAHHIAIPGYENPDSRDLVAVGNVNVRLAHDVLGPRGLLDAFYGKEDQLSFGTFDNLREYGVTVAVGGWTFTVFEHRNSDNIIVEGCPTAEVKPYGPYGTEDKWDNLFETAYNKPHQAVLALQAAVQRVLSGPATREQVKTAIAAEIGSQAVSA